jgi:PAS domain S-box-containing protein
LENALTQHQAFWESPYQTYGRDVIERQQMERALRESEQRFHSLIDVHPVPLGIVNRQTMSFLFVSPELARLVNCSSQELLDMRPESLFADPQEREDIRHQLRTIGGVDSYEFTLCKADGSTIPAAITAKRVVYEGMDATVGVILDLTERQQTEAELARQREALHQSEKLRALGALLAGVAHELNNPLAIVVGRSIMLEQEVDDAEIVTAVGKIRQAAERCTRIVQTFLAIARQHQPECVPVNLNDLITSTLELLDYGLRTASIKVHLDLAHDLPNVLADPAQLCQVVSHLFANAQQALLQVPEPRWLHVATHWDRAANTVNVEVIENGPGVPQELRSRIFEPFLTTKTVGAGTGVGLSLSHGIVTAHEGTLTLQDAPEGGARFVITLPLDPAVRPQAAATPQAETRVEPCSILIIEDEPDLAELFSRTLKRVGHHTVVVHSGHEALATLAEHDYDVILSDLHIPDLNGPDLYRELQVSYPDLLERIAFITGDALGEGAHQFLSEANCPYLEKPVFPAAVRRLVQQLLE